MCRDALLGKALWGEGAGSYLTCYLLRRTQDFIARGVAQGYDEGDALAGSGSLNALAQSLLRLLRQTAEVANGLEAHPFFDEAGGLGVNSRDEEVHQGIDLFLGA